MDSASPPFPSAARDGLSPAAGLTVEDDAAVSVAVGLAKEAALLFQSGKFVDCLRILNQLLQKKDDPQVRHNIVIAENFEDGCSEPKSLLKRLKTSRLKPAEILMDAAVRWNNDCIDLIASRLRSEELAHATGEHSEATSNDGRKTTAGIKISTNAAHQFSSSSVVYTNKFDMSVAIFNVAVVWFHLHKYAKSFSYLDTLYQNTEPIDEGTVLCICLLLLDVALLCHHASRSADVISYMEKVFCVSSLSSQSDNGTSAWQLSLLLSKSGSVPSDLTLPHSSYPNSVGTANASSHDLPGSQAEESLSVNDLRLKLHLYKVRFFLITRNLKAAKREANMARNLACGQEYPMALYLKSQVEYACRNYRKAIKLLMASSNHTENGIFSMYYNNLGCIYYQLGKHHTSGVFFSKALKNSLHVWKEKPPKLLALSQDKSVLISYNCGMHYLACGRPFHAAHCLQKASLIFYDRPLLWLRMAECCLMALEKGLIKSNCPVSDGCDIGVNVVGKGQWRLLALRYEILPNGHREYVGREHLFPGGYGKQPDLSMSFAQLCLVNAFYLLESSEAKYSRCGLPSITKEGESRETILYKSTDHKTVNVGDPREFNAAPDSFQPNSNGEAKEQKGGNNQTASLQICITDYEHFHLKENQMMKQALLADLAYVEMTLGNPLKAISTAKALLKLPECSRICIFLGTMYVAEALCLLNQPKEAAEHLMTYVSGGNNAELPYSREDCEKWKVEKLVDNEDLNVGTIAPNSVSSPDESQVSVLSSPKEARGIFCANYAANFALLGDLEQAHFVMKALSDIPNSPEQFLLQSIWI